VKRVRFNLSHFSKGILTGLFLLGLSAELQAQPLNIYNRNQLQKQSQTQSYTFVVSGDNRDGNSVLRKILKRAQDYQPRFMLHTGDFVPHGRKQEYLAFLKILQTASFPVLVAIGNHDALEQGRKWYKQFLGPQDFVFDYGPDRFVLLDNASKSLSKTQLAWLDRVLSEPKRYRFVVMHHPPQNLIWFYAFSEGAPELIKIIEKHHVNFVFMGHVHVYDKMISEGVQWVITGGAGAPLYRMPLYYSAQGGAYSHFLLMQVSPKGISEKIIKIE
jgi:3',5'-cyclic-AMP phosphodiesterase